MDEKGREKQFTKCTGSGDLSHRNIFSEFCASDGVTNYEFFHFPSGVPNMCTPVDTSNWFLLIVINIIAFQCTFIYFKGNAMAMAMATTAQIRWKQTNKLCGQCQTWQQHSDRLATLVWVLFFYYGAVEKGRMIQTHKHHIVLHIFSMVLVWYRRAPNWNLRMCLSSKFQTYTRTQFYIAYKQSSVCAIYYKMKPKDEKNDAVKCLCFETIHTRSHTHFTENYIDYEKLYFVYKQT